MSLEIITQQKTALCFYRSSRFIPVKAYKQHDINDFFKTLYGFNKNCTFAALQNRRGVRVVEGARLESVYMGNCIAGSNPALSAERNDQFGLFRFFMLLAG